MRYVFTLVLIYALNVYKTFACYAYGKANFEKRKLWENAVTSTAGGATLVRF